MYESMIHDGKFAGKLIAKRRGVTDISKSSADGSE